MIYNKLEIISFKISAKVVGGKIAQKGNSVDLHI
jgi:hypothetical protein